MQQMTPTEPSAYQLKNLYIYLEGGLPLRLAANSIGVTEATVRDWMQQNPEIEIRVGAAEAHFQLRCIDAIVSARDKKGNLNVRAMMFLLESRFPEQFSRKQPRKAATKSAANATPAPEPTPVPEPDVTAKPAPTTATETPSTTPIRTTPTPGHNAPCPCQSGHKYKHCCGATNPRARRTGLQTTLAEQVATAV
jgi:hypothetical protein